MISYIQAKKLLPPGDVVYVANADCSVTEARVLKVSACHLMTSAGFLDYQDHGYTWWLTKRGHLEKCWQR